MKTKRNRQNRSNKKRLKEFENRYHKKEKNKRKLKNERVWLDERIKELCNCPTCRALRKVEAMAFYNQHMADIQMLFYKIMREDRS